jgi:glycosyltransferase involved in cell wall biosynthesis
MKDLSLLLIVKNAEALLDESLNSVSGLVEEIVAIDNGSTDQTLEILRRHQAKIYSSRETNLGKLRKLVLDKIKTAWVLVLDSDEIVTPMLKTEIVNTLQNPTYKGYFIPFANHYLGRRLYRGGENYKKMILFEKNQVKIAPKNIHEKFVLKKGQPGDLKSYVNHYSYRTITSMYGKFTNYALREAAQRYRMNENSSLKKIVLYPIHMFWARFIKDKGYRDGLFRLPLDIGFAYMEFLTYWKLWKMKKK